MQLVLSVFPGIDLLGMGFERVGFTVVRGPDPLFGSSIIGWHPPANVFDGIIGGPPCQDFSAARRTPPTGAGLAMLHEFCRVVAEANPKWYLLENVSRVPTVCVPLYRIQRIDVDAREFGCPQSRLRHIQFGSRCGEVITVTRQEKLWGSPCCTASEGKRSTRRTWKEFCRLQGLPEDFALPSFNLVGRYRAVGNGVPLPMAEALARAVTLRTTWHAAKLCQCGCGRPLVGEAVLATAACRKRQQRRRDASSATQPKLTTLPLPFPSETTP